MNSPRRPSRYSKPGGVLPILGMAGVLLVGCPGDGDDGKPGPAGPRTPVIQSIATLGLIRTDFIVRLPLRDYSVILCPELATF